MQPSQQLNNSTSTVSTMSLPVVREQYWCFSRRTFLENVLIVALIAFGIFTLSLVVSTSVVGVKLDEYKLQVNELSDLVLALQSGCYPVCLTPQQIESASNIVNSLDTSIDPCDNFYDYVCNGWERGNQVPPHSSTWERAWSEAAATLHLQIEQILINSDKEIIAEDPLGKAKQFYKSCIDSDGGGADDEGITLLRHLIEKLEEFDTWPSLSVNIASTLDMQYLLPVTVRPDERNSSVNIIYITLPIIRTIPQDENVTLKSQSSYMRYLNESITLVEKDLGLYSFESSSELAATALEMEELILHIVHEANETRYNRMTIKQLQEMTSPTLQAQFQWIEYISAILNAEEITNLTEIVVQSPHYISNFDTVSDLYNTSFIDYMFLQIFLELGITVEPALRKIKQNFEFETSGKLQSHAWSYNCVEETNEYFGYAMSQSYLENNFNDSYISEIDSMTKNVLAAATQRLEELKWMDKASLQASKEKLQSISFTPPFQDWILQPELLQQFYAELEMTQQYFENLVHVRKWRQNSEAERLNYENIRTQSPFSPTQLQTYNIKFFNSVVVPASMITRPFFGLGDIALHYGAMGTVIAREMARAMDTAGRMYDKVGQLQNQSIWTANTTSSFNEKTECLVNQYNSYQVTPELKVDGVSTLESNVADAAGLQFAWLAFRHAAQHAVEYTSVVREEIDAIPVTRTLPGLEQFSAEQLFFLAYSHTLCTSYTTRSLYNLITSGESSPSSYRVLGTISNSEDFANVFSCNVSVRSVERSKCFLW